MIDSHAHLTCDALFGQIDDVLKRASNASLEAIINICTDQITLERGLELSKRYPWVYNAAATTPHDVEKEGELLFPLMEYHARNGDLVAVGETGLDYHYQHSNKETQQYFLKRYLRLALETRLPVIIHCREAFADFFKILDAEYMINGAHAPGVLHCFTGTVEEAEQVLNRGWFLSLSGIVTFKKSDLLRTIARLAPLERLFIETDAPYLAPQKQRGAVNEPAFLPEIVSVIAEVKGIDPEEVVRVTSANIRNFLGHKDINF